MPYSSKLMQFDIKFLSVPLICHQVVMKLFVYLLRGKLVSRKGCNYPLENA